MKILVGTPEALLVEKVLLNGVSDPDHMWIEVDEEAGIGTRYVTPLQCDEDGEALTKTVRGKFEIIMK
jgi:hypothetical protein